MTVPAISCGLGIGHLRRGLPQNVDDTHFPTLSMGIETRGLPALLTISIPSMVMLVISEGKTPGTIAFTSLQ